MNYDHILTILSPQKNNECQGISYSMNKWGKRDIQDLPHLFNAGLTDLTSNPFIDGMKKIYELEPFINPTVIEGKDPFLEPFLRKSPRKKLELAKRMIDLGADIHSADKSNLTPYQVAISERNKSISDLLRSKNVRRISPPGTGYAKHHDMYREIP